MQLLSIDGNGPPDGRVGQRVPDRSIITSPPPGACVPTSVVRRFTDPDEYVACIRAAKVELTITEAGRFAAKLIRIDLHRLWMQRFSENLSRVLHLDLVPGRAVISFPTQVGLSLLYNGNEMHPAAMARFNESHSGFQRAGGSSHFGAMSLPITDMEALGATLGGSDFAPPKEPLILTPPPGAMDRLQRLHAAAGYLAEHTPEVIANPDAALGLEQALIAALADCLRTTDNRSPGVGSRRHGTVMKRFFTIVEANSDRVIHLPELCEKIAVSGRTLNLCCQEALGMSAHHYLRVRQLNLARSALALADPAVTTVTEMATAYGFWELGRFSVAYRRLFGERPSETLRRPA